MAAAAKYGAALLNLHATAAAGAMFAAAIARARIGRAILASPPPTAPAPARRGPLGRRRKLVADHLPIFGQRPITEPADLLAILAEKHHDRHPAPAADFQLGRQIGICVAVEIADLNRRSGAGEMIEDRALIHAIAAPRPGQAKHFHLPLKARQQLPLRLGELDGRMDIGPAAAMFIGAVRREELVVAQTVREFFGEVEH